MIRSLACVTVLFHLCTTARAEIMVVPALEWLADHCHESGIFEVTEAQTTDVNNSAKLSLTLKKTFRGQPEKELQLDYNKVRLSDPERALVKKGDEFLLCFQHYSTGENRAVQSINLDHPQAAGSNLIAASCELKLLKTKKEILKVFEDRLKSHPKGDPVEISDYSKDNRFELSSGTELFSAVYGGSTCYLRVPTDLVEQVQEASKQLQNEASQK